MPLPSLRYLIRSVARFSIRMVRPAAVAVAVAPRLVNRSACHTQQGAAVYRYTQAALKEPRHTGLVSPRCAVPGSDLEDSRVQLLHARAVLFPRVPQLHCSLRLLVPTSSQAHTLRAYAFLRPCAR